MIIGDNMKALVTGGSSGIGLAIAKKLDSMGYDIILVSRNKKKLESVKQELKNNTTTIATDISSTYNCKKLFKKVKDEDIDILINCAGVGQFGYFNESKIVLLCSNLFKQKFEENCFVDSQIIEKWYQNKDYHYLYIASVNQILQK